MFFRWEPGATKNIGVAATLGAGAIGLVLAVYQVQGWKVPSPFAVLLIGLLVLMVGVAVTVIVYEVVQAVRRFLEHRATTPSWVSSEPPGLLDYEADGLRASNRFTKELGKLTRNTEKLGGRLERHAKAAERLAGASAKRRQRRANRSAKDINKSAAFIEKRLSLLNKLVGDIERNVEGLIATSDLTSDDELEAAREFRATLDDGHRQIAETVQTISDYRNEVRSIEKNNLARTVRIASGRLVRSLDGVVEMMRRHDSASLRLIRSLDSRMSKAERDRLKQRAA